MKGVEIVMYEEDGTVLFDQELKELRKMREAGRKDSSWIARALAQWEAVGFKTTTLDFRPVEGKPYESKLWEARFLKSARDDGVHGYRLFYVQTRRPSTGMQVVVLVMLWGKKGKNTPRSVFDEAWRRAEKALQAIKDRRFFCPPDGDGTY